MTWPERVALVHDRLDQDGGAERVLWALHEMFPSAPIHTSMWNRRVVPRFARCDVRVTWMDRLPGIGRAPRAYAALYPLAFLGLDLRGYDLVISQTSSFAKGVRTGPGSVHVCYCHSPSNFVWRPEAYFRSPRQTALAGPLRAWLGAWERWAARQPHLYVANGRTVAERVRSFYGRDVAVVHPPVDGRRFAVDRRPGGYYLLISRLVEQKRVELAVEATGRLGRPLIVVGRGRREAALRRLAGPTTTFLGWVPDDELARLYAGARALLQPGEEDFGLAAVEAQAAGTPVIAYGGGGALENVVDGVSGLHFSPQTPEALAQAIVDSESRPWDSRAVRAQAARFSEDRFRAGIRAAIDAAADLSGVGARRASPSSGLTGW